MSDRPQTDETYPTATNPRLRLLIPLVVAFAVFLEQFDSTIITTATPDIARGLHETPLRLNLALTSYILSLAVFIPVSGWVAVRYGMRPTFCAAIAIFTLAAMVWVSIPSVLFPTIGPLAGSLITTYWSWRWIFYVNIPFGILGIENFGRPVLPGAVVALIFCGAALMLGLYAAYARRRSHAAIDLTLLRVRTYRLSITAGDISRIAIAAPPFMLPLLLQVCRWGSASSGHIRKQKGQGSALDPLGPIGPRPRDFRKEEA